jgi:excisionase family DNA binding protein
MTTDKETIFHTVAEVAEILRVTPQTVRSYIRTKRLKATRIGRPLLISSASLEEFSGRTADGSTSVNFTLQK